MGAEVSVVPVGETLRVDVSDSTTGPGGFGGGLDWAAGLLAMAATAANTVATTIPATPSAAYGGRNGREPSLVGITASQRTSPAAPRDR